MMATASFDHSEQTNFEKSMIGLFRISVQDVYQAYYNLHQFNCFSQARICKQALQKLQQYYQRIKSSQLYKVLPDWSFVFGYDLLSIHVQDEVQQNDAKSKEYVRLMKRVSMEMTLENNNKIKPKFNSFMVQNSHFLQSNFFGNVQNNLNPGDKTNLMISEQNFSSYRSHLTIINSSENIFTKDDIQYIFNELADGEDFIRPAILKQCLFQINQHEDQAINMISLLDSNGNGVVQYQDFENFFLGKLIPKMDQFSMPENLQRKSFQVNLIEKNSDLLSDLSDPQVAGFVANEFENILHKH